MVNEKHKSTYLPICSSSSGSSLTDFSRLTNDSITVKALSRTDFSGSRVSGHIEGNKRAARS